MTPDAFRRDAYGYLANQSGHILLGIFLAFLGCFVQFLGTAEFPLRLGVWVVILLGYLGFEVVSQGWSGLDTVEDTAFVAVYGAGGTLWTFREINIGTGDFVGNVFALLPFVLVALAHLALGYSIRRAR